ncbi:hypothetical protein ACOJCM_03540 [Billgrantia sp. LNSP4103-1]|uniref:hypothetical protein n=1 Tax=Billgrantia sp. LNSP4103-1 TaxID=3410266 RepID=UPI00403FA39F
MIRLTWKAGSEFLEEKGPSVAIVLFMTFMSWILFWPHGLNISMAIGKEPEAIKYEKVRTSYSKNAAELMRYNEDIFSRSLSILDTKKYYCLLTEYFDTGYEGGLQPAALLRYESLCEVFSDAAALVDTYADRLNGWSGFYPELHEFTWHGRSEEQRIGPFLTQAECIEIADRLARLGEHASSCGPYGHASTESLNTALVADQG